MIHQGFIFQYSLAHLLEPLAALEGTNFLLFIIKRSLQYSIEFSNMRQVSKI